MSDLFGVKVEMVTLSLGENMVYLAHCHQHHQDLRPHCMVQTDMVVFRVLCPISKIVGHGYY